MKSRKRKIESGKMERKNHCKIETELQKKRLPPTHVCSNGLGLVFSPKKLCPFQSYLYVCNVQSWISSHCCKRGNVGGYVTTENEKTPLMKSKIEITEFRNRLKDNTKIGSPKLKIQWGILSIFADNSKCFYGNFDHSTFELITNSNFSPSFYFIFNFWINIFTDL
jgi:hypothetical protein